MRPGFHKINLASSKRLQRIHEFLLSRGNAGATGLEIAAECQALNPATYMSHLRANGVRVECVFAGRSENGAMIYKYFIRNEEAA